MDNSNTPNEIGQSVNPSLPKHKVRNRLPPELAQSIVALRLTGQSINQIAKGLGVNRATVKAHCRKAMDKQMSIQASIHEIIPDAVRAVHDAIKAGDARIAMQLLERMDALNRVRAPETNSSLTIAINTLMQPSPSVSAPHPSAREGEGDDLSVCSRGQNLPKLGSSQNFSPNSGDVIDVEEVK